MMPILVESDVVGSGRKGKACHARVWPTQESIAKLTVASLE